MTRWQLACEVCTDLAPWFLSVFTRVAVYMLAGFLAGYAAAGPRGALAGAGLGGLYVSIGEMIDLIDNPRWG